MKSNKSLRVHASPLEIQKSSYQRQSCLLFLYKGYFHLLNLIDHVKNKLETCKERFERTPRTCEASFVPRTIWVFIISNKGYLPYRFLEIIHGYAL